jgi:hypothetical protein
MVRESDYGGGDNEYRGFMSPKSPSMYDDDDPNVKQPILEIDGKLYD